MHQVEYRIERIPVIHEGPRTLQLVERLAELGCQRWHVASADLTPHPAYEEGPVIVLLEREVDGTVRNERPKSRSKEKADARAASRPR